MGEVSRQRYVWVLPLVLAVYVLLDGFSFLLLGAGADRVAILRVTGSTWVEIESSLPSVAHYINNLAIIEGLTLVGFAIMIIAASVTGYRRGERWAWFLTWYLPIYFLVSGILTYNEGVHISLEAMTADVLLTFFVISILVQLISYHWIFSKRTRAKQSLSS